MDSDEVEILERHQATIERLLSVATIQSFRIERLEADIQDLGALIVVKESEVQINNDR